MGLECELCQSNVILVFVIYQPCKHKSSQMYLYSSFQYTNRFKAVYSA